MRISLFNILGPLLAIWLVVGGIMFWARSVRPTPESLTRYLETHPVAGQSPSQRAKVLEKLANQLNQLPYEQRRELRMSRRLDGFFRALDSEEQTRFLDLTLPTGFKQMMEALNKMTPEKRKEFVGKALEDMKKHEGERPPDGELDANAQKIIQQGFKSFYSEANADVKMDVAPLLEQLQKNLQAR